MATDLFTPMTKAEKISKIRKLDYNIRRRLPRLPDGVTAPQAAYDRYKETLDKYKSKNGTLTKMSETQINNLYAQLVNIESMKTSHAKGATQYMKATKPIIDHFQEVYDELAKPDQKNVNKMLAMIYEQAPWIEKFKYRLMTDVVEALGTQTDPAILFDQILKAYEEEEYGITAPNTPIYADLWDEYDSSPAFGSDLEETDWW